jgi:hypothetical protein
MKKMRKLIPAFAMLMVAAIMMTTASFAWFTMNDEVTATGMQIQAKASGSLIISKDPLNWQSNTTTIDIDTGVNKLRPMMYKEGWKIPASDVDYYTGKVGADATYKTPDNLGEYYKQTEFYIGAAGDPLNGANFTMTLTAPVMPDGNAAYAYSVAIYVLSPDLTGTTTTWESMTNKTPTILHVDKYQNTNGTSNTVTLTNINVPSIVGVGAQDAKTTGLKVVVQFFVDGSLEAKNQTSAEGTVGAAATKPVVVGYEYKAATAYAANTTYYILKSGAINTAEAVYEAVIVPEGTTTVGSNWLVRELKTEEKTYNYINSEKVPTLGATLEIAFEAVVPTT